MTQVTLDLKTIYRKIETLEAALAYTIGSISVQMPAVKSDVVDALKNGADTNSHIDGAKEAFDELANLIDSIKVHLDEL